VKKVNLCNEKSTSGKRTKDSFRGERRVMWRFEKTSNNLWVKFLEIVFNFFFEDFDETFFSENQPVAGELVA
jgi:hypothetical protein